jgi:hypothetical protein
MRNNTVTETGSPVEKLARQLDMGYILPTRPGKLAKLASRVWKCGRLLLEVKSYLRIGRPQEFWFTTEVDFEHNVSQKK